MTLSAAELYRRGRSHLNAGRNAAARRDLAAAAARADDTDLLARIIGSTAAVVIRQGDPVEAERLCREALSYPDLSAQTTAMLDGQLGLIALERGDLDDAIRLLAQAIEGIGDEAEHRAPMLLNRSLALARVGDYGAARADLERAAPDYAATGNDVERAMAVHNAGYYALLEGDLIAAMTTMATARDALAAASVVNAAICDLDRAEVLRDAGLIDEAASSLVRVAQVFGANRMTQAQGEAEFHLARTLLAGDPARAENVARSAAKRFRRVRAEWWGLRADGVRVRAALLSELPTETAPRGVRLSSSAHRRVREAAEGAAAVAAAMREHGLDAEAEAVQLTVDLWRARTGEQDGAASAVVRVHRDAPIQLTLLTRQVQASRALALGREHVVRARAAAGMDALSDWQASFGSLDLATALAQNGGALVSTGLQSAVRSKHPAAVFEWSERARFLSQQVVPLRPPPDPGLAADLAELRALRVGGTDWFESDRARELGVRLRQRQWAAAGVVGRRSRASLEELQGSLDDETASVSFVYDGYGLAAVVALRDRAKVVRIEDSDGVLAAATALRADVDMNASVRSGPMAAVVQRTLEASVAALSASLFDPIVELIGDRRLVLSVPGILASLPWSLLPALRGRTFTIARSASQWLAAGPRPAVSRVAFAAGPRVARAGEEVARAASAWSDATIMTGADASVAAVTAAAAGADLLHVAAHGRHSHEHPLFSGLELGDGTLFGYDVDLIPHVPHTVVLSACEVGRSTTRGGEEAIGMTQVWMHAGSRCVVATPVIVADDVACELLGAMHEGLAAGLGPSAALADASTRTGLVSSFQVHGAGF